MFVAAPTDARDLDRAIDDLFTVLPTRRVAALRRLFVEHLDFDGATGDILLHHADDLPPSAHRVAERDGVHVVLVQFSAAGRLTGKGLADALKAIRRTLHGAARRG